MDSPSEGHDQQYLDEHWITGLTVDIIRLAFATLSFALTTFAVLFAQAPDAPGLSRKLRVSKAFTQAFGLAMMLVGVHFGIDQPSASNPRLLYILGRSRAVVFTGSQ